MTLAPRDDDPRAPEHVWGELALEPEQSRVVEVGSLELELRRTPNEFWIRVRRESAEDEGWLRWAAPPDRSLVLRPAAPDRLIVVSHEHPYHLPPKGESRIYVRMPLFVQVAMTGGDGDDLLLVDLPSLVLSDTWWGSFTEGELAYWLTTKARVTLTDDLFLPYLAMCPFRLVNDSGEALPVDRFAVRVPHLSLFRDGTRYWTDQVTVRYENAPEGSEIRFGGGAPSEAPAAALLAGPRMAPGRRFRARTFDRLRSLSARGF